MCRIGLDTHPKGMLEKKRARREADRTFREKGDEGLEVDESTLMGGNDSFQHAQGVNDVLPVLFLHGLVHLFDLACNRMSMSITSDGGSYTPDSQALCSPPAIDGHMFGIVSNS